MGFVEPSLRSLELSFAPQSATRARTQPVARPRGLCRSQLYLARPAPVPGCRAVLDSYIRVYGVRHTVESGLASVVLHLLTHEFGTETSSMWPMILLYLSAWLGRGWWFALLLVSLRLAFHVYVYPSIQEHHWTAFAEAQNAFVDVTQTVLRQRFQAIYETAGNPPPGFT